MEKQKCKLCSKGFANGRALGGHMKVHLAPLPIPPKHLTAESSTTSSSSLFFHESSDEEYDVSKAYIQKKSRKLPDHDVHGGEIEMESRSLTRRRSKRKARPAVDLEPVSSVSDTSMEEDAAIAMCLVMLSRDTRSEVKRHRCEICSKVFRSSQALGGHRVTHRKLDRSDNSRRRTTVDRTGYGKIFQCPYCCKVFSSGQALGGHKRSHVIAPSSVGAAASATPKTPVNLLDLNLPAPEEEDDCSVVSDAEITDQPIKTDH